MAGKKGREADRPEEEEPRRPEDKNAGARSLPQLVVQPIHASLAKLEHLLYKKCTRRGNQNPNQNQSIWVSLPEYLQTATGTTMEGKEAEADSKDNGQ